MISSACAEAVNRALKMPSNVLVNEDTCSEEEMHYQVSLKTDNLQEQVQKLKLYRQPEPALESDSASPSADRLPQLKPKRHRLQRPALRPAPGPGAWPL